jgi:tyrosyl-tRNA synthetase
MPKFLLPLNLQFFSEEPKVDEPATPEVDPKEPQVDNKIPYDRFKQKVDEANEYKRRLAEIETHQAEAERKQLEEQNEFKSLYEKTQAELDKIRTEAETVKIESLKTSLLVNAGYTGEQLERVRKYIVGADEEALKTSLEELKQDIPPKSGGVDPSVNNPQRQQPQQKDLADEGRSIYERLKAAGKIRR